MVTALNMGLIPCRAHSAAQRKRLLLRTDSFVVISHSKLDAHRADLLYVHVINSSHNGISLWVTAKYDTDAPSILFIKGVQPSVSVFSLFFPPVRFTLFNVF